jgi:hypothetical protein
MVSLIEEGIGKINLLNFHTCGVLCCILHGARGFASHHLKTCFSITVPGIHDCVLLGATYMAVEVYLEVYHSYFVYWLGMVLVNPPVNQFLTVGD